MLSDGTRNLFPAADRKTVALGAIELHPSQPVKPAQKRGRLRADQAAVKEARFRELLNEGLSVNAAVKEAEISPWRALSVLDEILTGLKDAA